MRPKFKFKFHKVNTRSPIDKYKLQERIKKLKEKLPQYFEKKKESNIFQTFDDLPKTQCKYCTKEFKSPQACKRHEKYCISSDLKWKCDECGKGYKTKEGLTWHKEKHQEFQLYVCSDCSKVYQSLSELRKHCSLFGHTFPVVEGPVLEDEQRCKICYKVYKDYTIEFHMQDHLKKRTKLYECDYCDYTTIRKNNLSRHLETKHNTWNIDFEAIKKHFEDPEKSYECPKCKKICKSYEETADHLQQKSCGEENICKICDIKFTMRQNLKAHMKRKHPQQ